MIEKVREYIKNENLIEKEDRVLVGLSGGADSMALTLLLKEFSQEMGFTLEAIHVEHGIRGEESQKDAAFVETFCKEQEIPLHLFHVKALEYKEKTGASLEEAARTLRYQCFFNVAQQGKNRTRLAVAHHMEDQAETVLFHMIRGSNLQGLCGMLPKNGIVIRPLLCVGKKEIHEYLAEKNQNYCEDQTNWDDSYARNRIRNQVFQDLKKINEKAPEHVVELAEEMQETEWYLQQETEKYYQQVCKQEEKGLLVQKEPFLELLPFMQRRVLYKVLCQLAGQKKNIEKQHISLLLELMNKQSGRNLDLPYEVVAQTTYHGIRLSKRMPKEGEKKPISIALPDKEILAKGYEIFVGKKRFRFRSYAREGTAVPEKKQYTKCFDYDKIKSSLDIRNREPGDYFFLDFTDKKQKLKSYFINEKIPVEDRDHILLLCDESHVLWVVGYRMSSYFKVTDSTRRILEVQIDGG